MMIRKIRKRLASTHGQMTVEFAVIFPVLLIVGFIACNAFVYLGDCASFDIVARDAMRLAADDGNDASTACAQACERIKQGLGARHEDVSVTCESTVLGHVRYTARTTFSPPFLRGVSVFGFGVPTATHEVSLVVSPHRKGIVV